MGLTRDKVTNEPKGDATVTYEDPHAASAAVEWFNNKDFHGSTIQVHIAESKSKDAFDNPTSLNIIAGVGEQDELDNGAGRGRGRGDGSGKAWQQDGDWMCPNTSCGNVNFAFRGVCNRCGAARPAGAGGAGGGGGGRGRGRGSSDARGSSRAGAGAAVGGPPGLFGPNDWPCPMCGNINWAKRTKCNICNTSKPGTNEGGVRGGRGGGYKELDEEELEEVKKRRKEAEEVLVKGKAGRGAGIVVGMTTMKRKQGTEIEVIMEGTSAGAGAGAETVKGKGGGRGDEPMSMREVGSVIGTGTAATE
ncbi:transcription initiation factor TFIID subunit 15-like isoform X6 [Panicum virgatum]|uniref:transcription initiation factor TFIID subunit 15-like isoform X6 n=1 Tax=Panicum virgatum TaxID=38727 RepID=UPI0019D553E2|nr:transcription initiation factor TFIID subunit 15-like isoform X6 [Panicum virgatum]